MYLLSEDAGPCPFVDTVWCEKAIQRDVKEHLSSFSTPTIIPYARCTTKQHYLFKVLIRTWRRCTTWRAARPIDGSHSGLQGLDFISLGYIANRAPMTDRNIELHIWRLFLPDPSDAGQSRAAVLSRKNIST